MTYIFSSFQMTNKYLEESNNTCNDEKKSIFAFRKLYKKKGILAYTQKSSSFQSCKNSLKTTKWIYSNNQIKKHTVPVEK